MAEDAFDVKATNGAAFAAALEQMRRDVAEPREPLQAAARELMAAAQAAAPRDTGRLAGSHRVLPPSGHTIRLVADTAYAAVIHWGWPGHGIRRQPWLVATWLRNPAPMARMTETVQADLDKAAART
jgi:hypothetical protein